jgi:hypothetical protein
MNKIIIYSGDQGLKPADLGSNDDRVLAFALQNLSVE